VTGIIVPLPVSEFKSYTVSTLVSQSVPEFFQSFRIRRKAATSPARVYGVQPTHELQDNGIQP